MREGIICGDLWGVIGSDLSCRQTETSKNACCPFYWPNMHLIPEVAAHQWRAVQGRAKDVAPTGAQEPLNYPFS